MAPTDPPDTLACLDDSRRRLVRRAASINGIETVEPSPPKKPGEGWRLNVYFLHPITRKEWDRRPIRIDDVQVLRAFDGEVVPFWVAVRSASTPAPEPLPVKTLRDQIEGFSVRIDPSNGTNVCTLELVGGTAPEGPLSGFDPFYARASFSLHVECLPPPPPAPPPPLRGLEGGGPPLHYLAKDYASFRKLLLDRLASTVPAWRDRYAADVGVTLVEALAYVGDHLSYFQDAIASEAYLGTARTRISIRRHARLVDYPVGEGCNARAWVHFEVDDPVVLDRDRLSSLKLYTAPSRSQPNRRPIVAPADLEDASQSDRVVFEPVLPSLPPGAFPSGGGPLPITLRFSPMKNALLFHTWGGIECFLPKGATGATIVGKLDVDGGLDMKAGDVLVLEEVVGPRTGLAIDADTMKRHAVRLTNVRPDRDKLLDRDVIRVSWSEADALPFGFCLATSTRSGERVANVTVARGNVLLVDHGLTLRAAPLQRVDSVVTPLLSAYGNAPTPADDDGLNPRPGPCGSALDVDGLIRPVFAPLPRGPVTHASPFPRPSDLSEGQFAHLKALRSAIEELPGPRGIGDAPDAVGTFDTLVGRLEGLSRSGLILDESDPLSRPSPELLDTLSSLLPAASRGLLAPTGQESWGPATGALTQDVKGAIPQVSVTRNPNDLGRDRRFDWQPRGDLLESGPRDRHLVVEVDDDGRGHLRFGDGRHGRDIADGLGIGPPPMVVARVGNGAAGNVGADKIIDHVHGEGRLAGVRSVRNPLPATGGVNPEPTSRVRLRAPSAIVGDLQRAITADDYTTLANRVAGVQRAAASMRRTGTGPEVLVAVDLMDRVSGAGDAEKVLDNVRFYLQTFRRVGHEVDVVKARTVPLEIALRIRVKPTAIRATTVVAVRAAVFAALAPDRLTFGQGVARDAIVALARQDDDVEDARVVTFRRRFTPETDRARDAALASGFLEIGPFEVARLVDDPASADSGLLTITAEGGR